MYSIIASGKFDIKDFDDDYLYLVFNRGFI